MAFNDYVKQQLVEVALYLFIVVFFGLLLPLSSGFQFKAFEESITAGFININNFLGTFLIYLFFIIIGLFIIIYPLMNLLLIRKGEHPATQPNPKWYRIFTVSMIFNLEDGALYQLSEAMGFKGNRNFMKWANILRVTVISILVFGTLGLIQLTNPEFNIAGVPASTELTQQITPSGDIIFGSSLPAIAENSFLLFILFPIMGIIAYLTAKFMKDKKSQLLTFFLVGIFVIAPLMGIFWMSLHSVIYSNSDASLLASFIFGFLGTVLTILFFIFIPWLIWHFTNNLFIKLAEVIEEIPDVYFITIIILSLIAIIWGSIEFLLWRRRKGKRNSPGGE